jgi:hypothetical protein
MTKTVAPFKALVSIGLSLESGSNEMGEGEVQDEEHDDSRISTFRGVSIDASDENENADHSIRINREFD